MTPVHFGSALANHLWQSTVFAGIAGLLVLMLRNNHARLRHWLWLIASLKFLIPFSLLSALGSAAGFLSVWFPASHLAPADLTIVVDQVSRPFQQEQHTAAAVTMAAAAHHVSLLPALLMMVWLLGFLTAVFSWCRRWQGVRALVRTATPLRIEAGLPVLSSPALLEPGVFGIFHPVLLLPQGITERMAPEHLQAIMAHELCHVRRRDNLTAALHMAVEAVFWFHPLVWWLGARLVEERERACDEEVLHLGSAPEVYAQSILQACQFYLESPLQCISGISGSDLKKRVTRIMTHRLAHRLSFGKKILLAGAGGAMVAGPILFGLLNTPRVRAQSPPPAAVPGPAFEVASIKPNHRGDGMHMIRVDPGGRLVAENVSFKFLLEEAYGVKDSQVSGMPGWLDSEHYDIEAKPEESFSDVQRKLSPEERRAQLMSLFQSLLADRLKLTLHHEAREQQLYVLVVAKNGPKLKETDPPPQPAGDAPPKPPDASGPLPKGGIRMMGRGQIEVTSVKLAMFVNVLSRQVGRVVLDKTGLTGYYDFSLKWTPDANEGQMFGGGGNGPEGKLGNAPPPPDPAGPSIFTALQDQLGLKLESEKGPVDTIVIDHIEKPSEN